MSPYAGTLLHIVQMCETSWNYRDRSAVKLPPTFFLNVFLFLLAHSVEVERITCFCVTLSCATYPTLDRLYAGVRCDLEYGGPLPFLLAQITLAQVLKNIFCDFFVSAPLVEFF